MQRVNMIIMLSSQLPNRNHKVVEFLDHRLDHLWRQGTLPLLCGIEGNQTTRSCIFTVHSWIESSDSPQCHTKEGECLDARDDRVGDPETRRPYDCGLAIEN